MRKTVRAGLSGVFGLGILTLVMGQAIGGPTTEFTVTGNVVSPATYDLASLGSLPPTTETVTFQTMNGPQTGSFTGPTLWTLLNTVGLQTPAVKNGILRQYVVAQGSDGYTSLFSLGELAPQFGGSNPQVLVAYQQNGAPLGSTGFARIVAANAAFAFRCRSDAGRLYAVEPGISSRNDRDRDLSRGRRPGDRHVHRRIDLDAADGCRDRHRSCDQERHPQLLRSCDRQRRL
jgi:hypothetical protein